jgi:hypothetical protein
MGRIIKELERIYGIKNGGDRRAEPQLAVLKSQAELASEMGMSLDKLQRLKKLADIPEEYQNMLEEGRISPNTAVNLISKLTEAEQLELIRTLPATDKITQGIAQQYIDQMKGMTKENADLKKEAAEALRAAKASGDGQEYLRMKEKLERAEKEMSDHRTQYESWIKEQQEERENRKTRAAERKAEIDKIKADAAAQVKNVQDQLEKANKRMVDLEKGEKKPPKKEIVEVVPDDYEELKRKANEYDAIKNSSEPDISKQILRIHTNDRTPEQKLNNYEKRVLDEVGGFLSILRGLEVQFDMCNKLSVATKKILRTSISDIQQILAKMDNAIMGGNEECKTA